MNYNKTLPTNETVDQISKILARQIDKEIFKQKYAKVGDVLKLVGAGFLLASSMVIPTLPAALLPFFDKKEKEAWKRFNIPRLKRTLKRLEKEKLVEIKSEKNMQIVKLTEAGRVKILKYAIDELAIEKPKIWDRTWWMMSYDIPRNLGRQRDVLREYLKAWGFFPLHESVFLHAYPCRKQVEFLREYLDIREYVRVIKAVQIENDEAFREFFGV